MQIVEIIRRSDQGATRPFLCRAEDNERYWVKGAGAGNRSRCTEWIAGRLAQSVGLPVPPFIQAEVPRLMIEQSMQAEIAALGPGLVFGSHHVQGAREFTIADIGAIPLALRVRLLLFDWWVKNMDRTLAVLGGNPNLLMSTESNSLAVIDHNLAFDPDFDTQKFCAEHVFGAHCRGLLADERVALEQTCRQTVARLDEFWAELPTEWLYVGADETQPAVLGLEAVRSAVQRLETDVGGLWECVL